LWICNAYASFRIKGSWASNGLSPIVMRSLAHRSRLHLLLTYLLHRLHRIWWGRKWNNVFFLLAFFEDSNCVWWDRKLKVQVWKIRGIFGITTLAKLFCGLKIYIMSIPVFQFPVILLIKPIWWRWFLVLHCRYIHRGCQDMSSTEMTSNSNIHNKTF
jgi:hypothetical protein